MMGYYTLYELVVDPPERYDEVVARLQQIAGWTVITDCEPTKWYGHEADLIALSAEFPDVLFELQGIGEEITLENPDVWKKEFLGGKKIADKRARLVFSK